MTTSTNMIFCYNRKLVSLFDLENKLEVGLVLSGRQVKQLRTRSSLSGSFIFFNDKEVFIKNLLIKPIKLLLHRKEITKLYALQKNTKGSSIQIIQLHERRGYLKLLIAVATVKSKRDRREEIKKRDMARSLKYDY